MEEEKTTLQDQLIDLLIKNNMRLIQYIEDKYNLSPTEINEQDIEDAIDEDKDWTEV